MKSSKRWTLAITLVLILSTVLSACGSTTPEVVEKVVKETVVVEKEGEVVEVEVTAVPEKKVFRFGRVADAVNPDPVMNDANYDIWYMQQYYSGLLRFTSDNQVEGDLAERWEVSDDGLTYTFYLRPDLKFADGSPILPEDWEWSLNRARNEENGIWWFTLEAIDTLEATEETVTFNLKQPYVPFLYSLALFNSVVMPKAQVEAAGGWEKFMEQPIGAGPYIMTEWLRGDSMTLVKNPNYWEADRVKVDEIILKTIPDDNTRILALQAGEVDAINYAPFNRVKDLEKDPNLNITYFPSTFTQMINFNQRNAPFDDVRVREALCYALDKQAMINNINFGVGEVATTFRPRGSLYYNDELEGWPFDLEKAKSLLEEAGYGDGFELTMNTRQGREAYQQIATLAQAMWAPLGIEVEINPLETGLYYDNYYNNNFEVQINGWTDDIPDPSQQTNYYMVFATAESVHSGFQSDEADQLAADALSETDPAKREQMYKRLQEIFNENTPLCPLWHEPYLVIMGPGVRNFYQTPLGTYIWRDLDVAK